ETLMADGWKWVEAAIDRPPVHHLRRIYPRTCDLSDDDQARIHALSSEYDALMDGRDPEEPLDEALGAALDLIAEELKTLEAKRRAYDAGDLARAGVFVVLGHDGAPCIEAGFVRAEDELVVEVGQNEDGLADPPHGAVRQTEDQNVSLLSEKLVGDLSAHFTAALIDQLGQTPHIALAALVYTLVLSAFRDVGGSSCLSISLHQARLDAHADGIRDSMACRAVEARHALWAAELPTDGDGLWPAILAMSDDRLVALLAHCVSLSANAVTATENRLSDHAVDLAKALDLNMAGYWTPTVANYLGRVTKPRILEAVSEGVTVEAAERIKGLQKQAMAEAAEGLLDGKRWLPAILRRHAPEGLPMDLAAE
ncbi:MAG: chromosome partitioning protein ParB, partial [Caulobacteraceae bacterium]|nr:chromosome partitioning protein ParB [Caulobacteraceae bacterium]